MVVLMLSAADFPLGGEAPPDPKKTTPTPTPIYLPRATATATAMATATATATPVPTPEPAAPQTDVDAKRGALLGEDRDAANAALETISLAGGEEALRAIADYLDRWEKKGDREMKRRGIAALRRLPVDAGAIARVVRDDPDPVHRAWAAWTAGEHEVGATGDALLAALSDSDARVRSRAVSSLGLLADPRAGDRLMRIVVHDPDPTTRERASEALVMLSTPRPEGRSPQPALAKLRSTDPFVRLDGAKALQKLRDHRTIGPALEALAAERDLQVRRELITAIAGLDDPIAVPPMVIIARTDSAEVRPFAIAALATLDDSRAVAPLIQLARDPDAQVRRYSLRALAVLDRPEGYPAVLDALSDPVVEVRSEAWKGLARVAAGGMQKEASDRAAARLENEPDDLLRGQLAATLGNFGRVGEKAHEKALVRALEDPVAGVRRAAAAALGRIGSPATEKALAEVAKREAKKKGPERDLDLIRIAEDASRQVKAR